MKLRWMRITDLTLVVLIAAVLPGITCCETLVSGRLTNGNGTPVANAVVVLDPATPGSDISAMRTSGNGRFAFSVASNRSCRLHFLAPGFTILTLPVRTISARLELPDAVLKLGPTFAGSTTLRAKQALGRAILPADLLLEIQKEIGSEMSDCLLESGESSEQMIRTTWLKLSTDHNPQLLVEGLGPCLAGANNGPALIYARFGSNWRKVFSHSGNRVGTLSHKTHDFFDLVRWQHASAFNSVRYVYQFDGLQYKVAQCNDVYFVDMATEKKYPKPKYLPCTWDWKD